MPVAAIVLDPDAAGHALRAVEGQTRPPDAVLPVGTSPAGRAAALTEALRLPEAAAADWVWILDAGVAPEPDALAELLAPLDGLGSLTAPSLLAGKVVGLDGALDAAAAPWQRLTDKETAVEATAHRLVSIRAARHGSLLVDAAAVRRHGAPRATYVTSGDDLEWTGRILKAERGYLVPASVAVRHAPLAADDRGYLDVRNRVDMLRSGVWDGDERLWFGLTLAQDVARGVGTRSRRASVLRGVRDGLSGRAR